MHVLQQLLAGVLASLVRVNDFGRSVGLYSPLQTSMALDASSVL